VGRHDETGEDSTERCRDEQHSEPRERKQRPWERIDAHDGPREYVAGRQEERVEGEVRPMESSCLVEDPAEVNQERRPSEGA
jgi:hypothetical protein